MQRQITQKCLQRLGTTASVRQFGTRQAMAAYAHTAGALPRPQHPVSDGRLLQVRSLSTSQMTRHAAATAHEPQPKKSKTCWQCHRESDPACVFCTNEKCQAIQPVSPAATYFDVLLGGRRTFDIDMSELRRAFLKLQQGVHPDSYSQKEDIERTLAETQSSWINRGYATLRDPLHRAHYLLKLAGREINEEDKITDPELLMEVMELREEIEMAKCEEEMAAIKRRNDGSIEHVVEELSGAFGHNDLDRARQLTNHFQYLRRVSQAIQNWEPGKPVEIAH